MRKLVIFATLFLILSFSFISSARLPTVSGDDDAWGDVLNEFLNVSHNATGEIKSDAVLNFTSNLTLGSLITFGLLETIDNLVDGWIRISGGLNVTGSAVVGGDLNVTGVVTATGINLTFPTCSGTDKLTFDGSSFSCAADQSASGGTGIVESGSNSSGSWIKFADGTAVQWGNVSVAATSLANNNIGTYGWSLYYGSAQFTYPVPFISAPNIQASPNSPTGSVGNTASAHTITSTTAYVSMIVSGSFTGNVSWTAIGRWTALTNISVNDTTWAVNATTGNVGLFDSSKNVTIGKLLTFGLLETIDNLVDGWLRVNGNLNVTGNLSLGNGQIAYNDSAGKYYYYNGTWNEFGTGSGGGESIWENVSGTATYIGSVNITGNLTLGGDVTGQNTSRVRVTKNSSQTFTDATDVKVQFDFEEYDTLSEYDNTTNYRFTATQAGYYLIHAKVLSASVAWSEGQGFTLRIFKNGVWHTNLGNDNADVATTKSIGVEGSSILYLSAGDYIEIYVQISRGSDTDIFTTNNKNSYLEIQRINSPITIGSTAGVPTGAMVAFTTDCPVGWTFNHTTNGTGIVDSGNNSNGSWIKYSDGRMEVWAYNNSEETTDTATGNIFYSAGGSIVNFPQTFTSVQTVIPIADGNAQSGIVWADAHYLVLTNSKVNIRLVGTVGTYTGLVGAHVIGRWTETPQQTLNWCVKTGEDSAISNTIWAESGDDIILNNQSKSLNLSNTSTTYYSPNASEESIGTLHMIPEANRVAVVDSYTTFTSNWIPVNVASYVPEGTKAVMLYWHLRMTGDATSDYVQTFVRKGGSSLTARPQIATAYITFTNLGSGVIFESTGTFTIELNSSRVFEHQGLARGGGGAATGALSLDLVGYYI